MWEDMLELIIELFVQKSQVNSDWRFKLVVSGFTVRFSGLHLLPEVRWPGGVRYGGVNQKPSQTRWHSKKWECQARWRHFLASLWRSAAFTHLLLCSQWTGQKVTALSSLVLLLMHLLRGCCDEYEDHLFTFITEVERSHLNDCCCFPFFLMLRGRMFLSHLLDGLGVIITMDVIKVTHPLLEPVLKPRGERILSPTLKRILSPIQVEVGESTIIYTNLGSIGK